MIPAIPGSAGAFWNELCAAEAKRRSAREIRATGNHRVAQNDEPEPTTFAAIHEQAQAEARAILRGEPVLRQVLRAADLNQAEQFAGAVPFVLDGGAR